MAYSESFTATQILGLPNLIVITDTSTGSDAAIASRRILLEQYNGSFLVPSGTTTDYIAWATGTSSKTLDVLTVDTALNITVQWLSVGGTVLYESVHLYVFTLYNQQFDYGLTSDQSGDPEIVNNTSYYNNRIKLRVEIDNAQNAVSIGSDLSLIHISEPTRPY